MSKPMDDPNLLDLRAVTEHVEWTAARQSEGLYCIRLVEDIPSGGKFPRKTHFFPNRSQQLAMEVRQFLRQEFREGDHVFYGVNAYSQPRAKAAHAVSGRLLHVDADGVAVPPPGPSPSRIIQSSPGNYHFFYELDAPIQSSLAEKLSRSLTKLVGGDVGGHSSAKLLRMPGTINAKY